MDAGQFDARIGTVCGKLLTMTSHFEIPEKPVVDSTGIYFNPMLRHLDRGSQEVDNGHYLQYEYVFGATRGRGAVPAGDDRQTSPSRANSSIRISSCTARTRTSPGAPN